MAGLEDLVESWRARSDEYGDPERRGLPNDLARDAGYADGLGEAANELEAALALTETPRSIVPSERLVNGLAAKGFIIVPMRQEGRQLLAALLMPLDMRCFVAIQAALTEAYPALGDMPASEAMVTTELPDGQLIQFFMPEEARR